MFTGIIEEVGTVRDIERGAQSARFTIGAEQVTEGTRLVTALPSMALA